MPAICPITMKESIAIKNLGPLTNVYIDHIKPMTLLIGDSGSGKSLLMKTVVLFRYLYKMLNIRWYFKNSNIKKSLFRLQLDKQLSPELKLYFSNPALEIVYTVEINGHIYEIAYRKKKLNFKDSIPNADLVFLKESWISEMRNIIPQWLNMGSMPKNRIFDFYFQETLNDFQDATNQLNGTDLSFIGMKLQVTRKAGIKKYFVTPTNGAYDPLEWRFASSGIQTSASILTLADYFANHFSFKDAIKRSIISYLYDSDNLRQYTTDLEPMDMRKIVHMHIEEPEQNLFPPAQIALVEELVKRTLGQHDTDRDINLMIATHSPYIANYINILINRRNTDRAHLNADSVAVYRIFKGQLQSLMCRDEYGHKFVDTTDLVEPMADIMQEYQHLTEMSQ